MSTRDGGKSNLLGPKKQDGFLTPSPARSLGPSPAHSHGGHSPGYSPRTPGSPISRQSTMSNDDDGPHHSVFKKEDIMALPDDASIRFDLLEEIGQGTYGLVHRAIDNTTHRDVAIKIVENIEQNLEEVIQEFQILSDHSLHPNIPQLFGAFRCGPNIWFSLELCSGGPASELARQLVRRGRRLIDEQIAYIIKEVLHALIYLQESQCIHRDVKGSNILLNENAEVKLVDFGISCQLESEEEKRRTRVGTPYWMAPEVILAGDPDVFLEYDGRCDVWSLGITVIELAEGEPPLSHLQPMRALMQIPKNPPPRISHPEEWSVALNDIVEESLIKDHDHRPMLQEIIGHPLFQMIPRNPSYIQHGLTMLMKWVEKDKILHPEEPGTALNKELRHKTMDNDVDMIKTENIVHRNDYIQSKNIAETIQKRREANHPYTFIGDLLLAVDPEDIDETNIPRLESSQPHIISVTEILYDRMFHEAKDQLLLPYGTSTQGLRTLYSSALKHLLNLGSQDRFGDSHSKLKIESGEFILKTLMARSGNQTKTAFRVTNIHFNCSGSVSGAEFKSYFPEGLIDIKSNLSSIRVFKTVLIGLRMQGRIREFGLQHFIEADDCGDLVCAEEDATACFDEFIQFIKCLQKFGFRSDTGVDLILRLLVAIQLLFKIKFTKTSDSYTVETRDVLESVSNLLELEEEFLVRALTQTNIMTEGQFYHQQDPDKNVNALASALYARLLDWVEHYINGNLKLSLRVFGYKNSITLLELPGTQEIVEDNFGSMLSNTTAEMMHYIITKQLIKWEEIEATKNRIKLKYPSVPDNKAVLDALLGSGGFLTLLHETAMSKEAFDPELGLQFLQNQFKNASDCHIENDQLLVNHFWGQVTYDIRNMSERNQNFINPDLIQTMAGSSDECLRNIFQIPLDNLGKLNFDYDADITSGPEDVGYSQTLAQQTIISRFRHWIDLLTRLIINTSNAVVFCFDQSPKLAEQIEAFNIKEVSYVRKKGFPFRLTFADFLRNYCFLAFNFDERVVATRENAQLLMIRLAMDGFECGRSKIFLKYYQINYLSEMYVKQLKRIVIIQSTIRRYLARKRTEKERTAKVASTALNVRRICKIWRKYKSNIHKSITASSTNRGKHNTMRKNEAATEIQRHIRGFQVRKKVKVEVRFNVLNCLASPMPERKEKALGILKDAGGLSADEAKAAMENIEEAIKENKINSIITKEERLKVFLEQVYSHNMETQHMLKKEKESVDMNKIQPPPPKFRLKKISVKDLNNLQRVTQYNKTTLLPPIKLYDIAGFYTDAGPSADWNALLEERTKQLGIIKQREVFHVIKERSIGRYRRPPGFNENADDLNLNLSQVNSRGNSPRGVHSRLQSGRSSPSGGVRSPRKVESGRHPSGGGTGGRGSPKGGRRSNALSPKVVQPFKNSSPKSGKSAVVNYNRPNAKQHANFLAARERSLKKPKTGMGNQIVNQLNMIKASAEVEEDGPFDFRSLLRKTDILPTDTLKKCRLRNIPCLTQSEDGIFMSFGKNEIAL